MKNIIFITTLFMFLIMGCSRDNSTGEAGKPKEYNLYLNISKADGSSYSEGEVEVRRGYIDPEGQIKYNGEWNTFKVDRLMSDRMNKNCFGPYFIGMSITDGKDNQQENEGVYNQILLLRAQESQKIDTLKIRDSISYPEYRYFDIFKNDDFIKRFEITDDYENEPWLISLTK